MNKNKKNWPRIRKWSLICQNIVFAAKNRTETIFFRLAMRSSERNGKRKRKKEKDVPSGVPVARNK